MTYDRTRPYSARLVDKRALAGPGSARPTLHVSLAIDGAAFPYQPGDVVAVYVQNEPQLVQAVLDRLGLDGSETVTINSSWDAPEGSLTLPLRRALAERLSLGAPPLRLLRAAIDLVPSEDEAVALEDLCDDDEALDVYLAERDLLDFLSEHPALAFDAQDLVQLLPGLQPRTYSVASSPRAHPDEIHLTVGVITWERGGRTRTGVASAHLARMEVGERLPMYWTASKHFRMPEDAAAPLVCVGPGTGVAPFRGFLQDRAHAGGGPTWLFFGAQTRAHDFYYEAELAALRDKGALARLDLAFSRDQPERVYVQQRMREAADELYAWLERGAYLYVCGDASKMAPDVERALVEIAAARGRDGEAYLQALREAKRYRRDVY